MTLTVTLDLSPEAEAQLQAGIDEHNAERVGQVLLDALRPTVERLLQETTSPLTTVVEWDDALDQLVNMFAARVSPDTPILSDYAVSRAGIYEDHP